MSLEFQHSHVWHVLCDKMWQDVTSFELKFHGRQHHGSMFRIHRPLPVQSKETRLRSPVWHVWDIAPSEVSWALAIIHCSWYRMLLQYCFAWFKVQIWSGERMRKELKIQTFWRNWSCHLDVMAGWGYLDIHLIHNYITLLAPTCNALQIVSDSSHLIVFDSVCWKVATPHETYGKKERTNERNREREREKD